MSENKIKSSRNPQIIQDWIERRGGFPAISRAGMTTPRLGIHFPGYADKGALEEIPWDRFFALFCAEHLTFYYQERATTGRISRFYNFKLASRLKRRLSYELVKHRG